MSRGCRKCTVVPLFRDFRIAVVVVAALLAPPPWSRPSVGVLNVLAPPPTLLGLDELAITAEEEIAHRVARAGGLAGGSEGREGILGQCHHLERVERGHDAVNDREAAVHEYWRVEALPGGGGDGSHGGAGRRTRLDGPNGLTNSHVLGDLKRRAARGSDRQVVVRREGERVVGRSRKGEELVEVLLVAGNGEGREGVSREGAIRAGGEDLVTLL
mmetsp:Transcript_8623/g.17533  ORF Transcript_8623/g.17533 Transcript_8623/m.17533 type:complete len:215 (-) Transcript_8623:1132-1776(-)